MNTNPAKSGTSSASKSVVIPFPNKEDRGMAGQPKPHIAATFAATSQEMLRQFNPVKQKDDLTWEFPYKGRHWRMYKRAGQKDAHDPWQIWIEWQGVRKGRSTGCSDKEGAKVKARQIIDAVMRDDAARLEDLKLRKGGNVASPPAVPGSVSTVGDLLREYENCKGLRASEDTRDGNMMALRNVIRRSLSLPLPNKETTYSERRALNEEVGAMSGSIFDERLARRYWLVVGEAVNGAKKYDGQEAAHRVKTSLTSLFMQGLSVFQPRCLLVYKDAGLILPPALVEFLAAAKAEKPSGLVARYNPPPEPVIDAVLHEWVKLEDRGMFLTLGLELALGLRRGEVPQITWGMLTQERGRPLLDSRNVQVKSQLGQIQVPPLDPFWSILVNRVQREGWRGQADEPIVSKTEWEWDVLFRQIGSWMQANAWTTVKKSHALRAYSGSLIAMKWGIYRASQWLRHSTIKVTERHYTHYLSHRVFRPEEVLIRWGRQLLA